jgi:hypothetical protein
LFGGQPVANPNAELLGAFDASNPGRQLRTEQAGISGFVCQAADRRKPKVDR